MRVVRIVQALAVMLIIVVASCSKDAKQRPQANVATGLVRPAHFPAAYYDFGDNIYSRQGFELGRRLFFDPLLSVNNTISCGSCHRQQYAFADGGKAFSRGIYGRSAARNSPAIFNMAWNTSFMWDGGVNHIEVMPLAPLTNPAEMGEEIKNIVQKLNSHNLYPALFREAFHIDTIDDRQMFWALAQYMSNIVSAGSRYDKYITGNGTLTDEELKGLQLFRIHCADCHKEPLFTNYSFQNNGLDSLFADAGRFRITHDSADMGKFKVPTLRNIMLTYPYMHDGRFTDIRQVLEHYSTGIVHSPTLSPLLNKGKEGLQLSPADIQALLSFLQTLTDEQMITNPDLSE